MRLNPDRVDLEKISICLGLFLVVLAIGLGVFHWAVFYANLAFVFISVVFYLKFGDGYELLSLETVPLKKKTLGFGLLCSSSLLMLSAVRWEFLEESKLAIYAAILTLILFLISRIISRGNPILNYKMLGWSIYICGTIAIGLVVNINCRFDDVPVEVTRVIIKNKYYRKAEYKSPAKYDLVIDSELIGKIDVSKKVYSSFAAGDFADLHVFRGLLGIKWVDISKPAT